MRFCCWMIPWRYPPMGISPPGGGFKSDYHVGETERLTGKPSRPLFAECTRWFTAPLPIIFPDGIENVNNSANRNRSPGVNRV
jgi:hypothetical protein